MAKPLVETSIDVAICTYRRESLRATIASVAGQQLPVGYVLRIIVADNDASPSAADMVQNVAAATGANCHYVHAPARNISIARNACLDAAEAPLLAFIDDDEIAGPNWITALVATLEAAQADAVLGPAHAVYPPGAPRWAVDADLHSTRPVIRNQRILTGYTCNVLLRLAAFEGLRFDPKLGRSGGEDDVFFAQAVARGATIAFAPDAVVDDPVPDARLHLGWLLRRAFRNGQTYAAVTISRGTTRFQAGPIAASKALACALAALFGILSPARWRAALVRGALHSGAVARYLGMRPLELY